MKHVAIHGILLCQVLFISSLDGCKREPQTTKDLRPAASISGTRAIRDVLTALSARLGSVRANPEDLLQTIKAMDAYASAYSDADVTECPEEFRKQFYETRLGWVNSVTALQQEALYLQRSSQRNTTTRENFNAQAALLAQSSASAMENAFSQHQELRAIARNYGVDWTI